MTAPRGSSAPDDRRWAGAAGILAFGLTLVLLAALVGSIGVGPSLGAQSVRQPNGTVVEFVNVSLAPGSAFAFIPDSITVLPGAQVHLAVTQTQSIDHTFVLSSVANLTIPISDSPAQVFAFLNQHAPLVNLSLGSTIGGVTPTVFTAPPLGTYEFFCEVPGHLQGGMVGLLYSGTSPSSSGSSGLPLSTELILAGVGVGVIVIALVFVVVRRRSRDKPKRGDGPSAGSP